MTTQPAQLLILNQMAGPMTWELAEDVGEALGRVALLTGHPDTLAKPSTEAILICRAAAYERGGAVRRALSWLRYLWQAFWWIWRFPKHVPLLLFSNPPMLCWLGFVMRLIRGQRYSVMVHDIYPDVLIALKQLPARHLLIRIWRVLNRVAYQHADVVMTLGECMAEKLATQFDPAKTPGQRIEVIYPWVDTDKIKPIPKVQNWFARKYHQVDKLTVMYSGNMGLGHDIETMIEVALRLRNEPRIHFMFIGAGPKWQRIADSLQEQNLPNVTLLPWQAEETLPFSLASADIAIVSLEEDMTGLAIPSKAIYAMAAGSATIALVLPKSELSTWIQRFEHGVTLHPGKPDEFANVLHELVNNPSRYRNWQRNARLHAEHTFSRHVNTSRILETLNRTLWDNTRLGEKKSKV